MSDILLEIALADSAAFASGQGQVSKTAWEYFEYSVKLVFARWTALRMAMEGQWGGGDLRRKYELLLEEVLNVYKYSKNVYADDLALSIADYVEAEFGLICEDGSVEEIARLMSVLADECKKGNYDRVRGLHDHVQTLVPIDLKKAKVRREEDGSGIAAAGGEEGEQVLGMVEQEEELMDEDGFVTVRRSSRRRAAPKMFDPAAEFPGAM